MSDPTPHPSELPFLGEQPQPRRGGLSLGSIVLLAGIVIFAAVIGLALIKQRQSQPQSGPAPSFERVARPVRAGEDELARNPRARSATLRVAHRTSAPAHTSAQGRAA